MKSFLNVKVLGVFAGIVAALVFVEMFTGTKSSGSSGKVPEVKWKDLYSLDYKTGKAPPALKAFDGKRVKIAGFVVPLTDNFTILEEFLLVPDAQSCIHVPPPPPNLIVQSKLKTPLTSDKVYNPAWITGTLRIETAESKYGAAGFQMEVEKLEEYVY